MPLGVRDFLLIIRAKDQASRVVSDVGRSFGKLNKQSTAAMREAANNLRTQSSDIRKRFQSDVAASQESLKNNQLVSSQLSRRNAQLRIAQAQAVSAADRITIGDEIRNNTLRKAMLAEQNTVLRQGVSKRRDFAREELDIVRRSYNDQQAAFQRHNDDIQARADAAIKKRQQGQSLLGIGAGIAVVGAAGLAFLGGTTKDAISYNKEASKTLTQVNPELGATLEDVKRIGKETARAIPAPFEEMQASLYDIFSSMDVNVTEAERLLRAFAQGAVAGVTDVETASQAAISFLNAFKLPPTAENIKRVMDAQFETVRIGRIEYDEFAKTVGRTIPSAVKAGQSIEDLGGLFAFLTRNGLSAAMSATSAARAYDLMTNTKFKDRMKQLGIEVADAEGKFRPFQDIMADLRNRLNGVLTPEQAKNAKNFLDSVVDPEALSFLEKLGIQVKQTVGGKDFKAQIASNMKTSAALTTENAKLRLRAGGILSKAEKKTIADTIKNNNVRKALLAEQNLSLRAAGSKATESIRPVAEIMADLNNLLKQVSPEEAAEIMHELTKGSGQNIQAMRAIALALFDTDGALQTMTADANDNADAMANAYKIMAATPAAKIQELRNKYNTLKTEIGDNLLPVLIRLVSWGGRVLDWFTNLSPKTKTIVTLVAAASFAFFLLVGAVTAAAGAFLILQAALAPFGLTVAGITLAFIFWLTIIAAMTLAIYILLKNWDDFKLGLKIILAEIVDAFLATAERILAAMNSAFGWIPGIGPKLQDSLDSFRQWRQDVNREILGIKPLDVAAITGGVGAGALTSGGFTPEQIAAAQAAATAPVPKRPAIPASPNLTSAGKIVPFRRALGGPAKAFHRYVVGENGWEVLEMGNRAGRVINQQQLQRESQAATNYNTTSRGGDTVNNNITVNAHTDADSGEISHDVVFALRYG